MAGLADWLSAASGNPINHFANQQEGTYRAAQTEGAIQNARLKQSEALLKDFALTQTQDLAKYGVPGVDGVRGAAIRAFAGVGTGANDITKAAGNLQEQDFRATAADPLSDWGTAQHALMGVANGPVVALHPLGAGGATNIMADPTSPGAVQTTSLGDALIGADHALATQRNASAVAQTAAAGLNDERRLHPEKFRTTPAGGAGGGIGGSINARFDERVINAGELASKALENIGRMSPEVSTGIFGVGSAPSGSILDSAKGALVNKLADKDVINYNTFLAGVSRNLATIESAGLAPNSGFTESFAALQMRPGDTLGNRMTKMAEMRQIIEHGLATKLNRAGLAPETKAFMQAIVDRTRAAVPFTVADVQNLENAKNPKATLADAMRAHIGTPKTTTAPAATAPAATVMGTTGEQVSVAPQAALDYLEKNPAALQKFIEKYKYNPFDNEAAQ